MFTYYRIRLHYIMNYDKSYNSDLKSNNPLSNTLDSKYTDLSVKNKIKKKNKDEINIKKYFYNKNIKYNLESRIFYYKNIVKKIKDISNNECLNIKINNNNNETINYTIKDKITLIKRIGTSSKYGYIYIAKIKNEFGKRPITAKLIIQNTRNILESELNSKITDLIVKKNISKHFILTYKVIKCNLLSSDELLPDIIKDNNYIMLLNEVARGDLKALCKDINFLKSDELLYNVFAQTMLSILTFHHLGYVHNDCHWGNFLYHYIDDKDDKNNISYYQYNINGENYYLKASKYSIYIYDFGLCSNIKYTDNYKIYDDYKRITNPFISQKKYNYSWLKDINMPVNLPSDKFSNFVINYGNNIKNFYNNNKYVYFNNNSKFLKELSIVIINDLLKMPNNYFVNKKPHNSKIINAKPFQINSKINLHK